MRCVQRDYYKQAHYLVTPQMSIMFAVEKNDQAKTYYTLNSSIRFYIIRHFKTRKRAFSNQGRMMQNGLELDFLNKLEIVHYIICQTTILFRNLLIYYLVVVL